MNLVTKSRRYGQVQYCKYEGMDAAAITTLMSALGHTEIEFIEESQIPAPTL